MGFFSGPGSALCEACPVGSFCRGWALGGVGDRLFTDTDGGGAGDLLATKGKAPFGLLVYPPGKIPAEGIRLRVEVKVGAQWVVFAEDRIIP